MGLFMLNNFQDEEYPKPPKNNEDYDYVLSNIVTFDE